MTSIPRQRQIIELLRAQEPQTLSELTRATDGKRKSVTADLCDLRQAGVVKSVGENRHSRGYALTEYARSHRTADLVIAPKIYNVPLEMNAYGNEAKHWYRALEAAMRGLRIVRYEEET